MRSTGRGKRKEPQTSGSFYFDLTSASLGYRFSASLGYRFSASLGCRI